MSLPDAEAAAETRAAVTIGRPATDLRELWLRPATQSAIWSHFALVSAEKDGSANWSASGPALGTYRWRTMLTGDEPDRLRWSSHEGADLPNTGVLIFRPAPGDRGTELHLDVHFDPPGGAIGAALGKLFHLAPREIVLTALYKFRALAVPGEIPTTDPQPAARKAGADR
jgi:uncharacterized membrane protein